MPVSADAPIKALETSLATLRPLALGDAESLFEVFADPETMRHFGKPHADPAETRALLGDLEVERADNPWCRLWAIVPRGETACRGWVGLMNRIPNQDNAEFSIILHPDWQGRGIARAAARAAFAFGYGTWGLHRVYAVVVSANGPSVRLAEALGFRREGRLREAFRAADAYHDDLLYALLAGEYDAPGGAAP